MKMRVLAGAGVLTLGLLGLTGCVNPVEQLVNDTVENAIEGATGVEVDTGSGASVPDGFPTDIALPPGSPTVAVAAGGGFTVTYTLASASDADPVIAELTSTLTVDSESDFGGMKIWSLTGTDYGVAVTLLEQDDGTAQLMYVVTPAGS